MKLLYNQLSKEERKEARNKYFSTETGLYVKNKLKSSLICSILCMITGIFLTFDAFLRTFKLIDKIYGILTIIIGIAMFIIYFKIRNNRVNNYLIKNKKNKN